MVSKMAFKIIRDAVGIRVRRGEGSYEDIVKIYNKLSDEQAQEILDFYNNQPKEA